MALTEENMRSLNVVKGKPVQISTLHHSKDNEQTSLVVYRKESSQEVKEREITLETDKVKRQTIEYLKKVANDDKVAWRYCSNSESNLLQFKKFAERLPESQRDIQNLAHSDKHVRVKAVQNIARKTAHKLENDTSDLDSKTIVSFIKEISEVFTELKTTIGDSVQKITSLTSSLEHQRENDADEEAAQEKSNLQAEKTVNNSSRKNKKKEAYDLLTNPDQNVGESEKKILKSRLAETNEATKGAKLVGEIITTSALSEKKSEVTQQENVLELQKQVARYKAFVTRNPEEKDHAERVLRQTEQNLEKIKAKQVPTA